MTDLIEPWRVVNRPGVHFIEPLGKERIGDVSNVVFCNGWILDDDGIVLIYYSSSDTRMQVDTTTLDKLVDFVCNTPEDPGNTQLCAAQRDELILNNLKILARQFPNITY